MRTDVLLFPNGNVAVLRDGQQVPELQEPWLLHVVKFLESKGVDPLDCKFTLPGARVATIFKTTEGSWNWSVS